MRPTLPRLPAALVGWLLVAGLIWAQPALPPKTEKKPVTDEYHGVKVTEDYRWLETASDPAVREWMLDQNRHSRAILNRLPGRSDIMQRLKTLYKSEGYHFSKLTHHEGKLFAESGGAVVVLNDLTDANSERLIVDPEEVTGKRTTDIDFYVLSPDGKKVAVSLSMDGKQDGTVYVFDVNGKKLADEIPHVCSAMGGSLAWKGDGSGFYYTRNSDGSARPLHKPGGQEQIWFHELGKPVKDDVYVFGKDFDPLSGVVLETSPKGKYLLATVTLGWTSDATVHYVMKPDGEWVTLNRPADNLAAVSFGPDDSLWMLSRKDAPRGAIYHLGAGEFDLKKADLIIPQGDTVLQSLAIAKTKLYLVDRKDGGDRLWVLDYQGKNKKSIPVPETSHVDEVVALDGDEVLYSVESYLTPSTWHVYDPDGGKKKPAMDVKYPNADFANAEVVLETVTSKDGTKVPLTILRTKGTKLDGNNPVLMEGYGGYGHTLSPEFSASKLLWLEQGGVWAIAHIRGDGDSGEDWHRGALGTKKQNSFDDFIACAKWLIDQKYTKPEKLAIEGGSNGGTLVGVALVQRPDLFKAVVAQSGNYDCLRQELHPAGKFDIPEFGTVKVKEEFEVLYSYSPFHQVKDKTDYPAVLIVCGENDPRVDPADSRKFAARLQAATSSKNPVLLYTRLKSGHSCLTFEEELVTQADRFAFCFNHLGVEYKPVKKPKP